jgi:putative membrane protein
MTYLTGHWSFDPFGILALAVAAWHEIGLRRLARRSRPDRTRQRRIRSLWFYAGLGVLLLAVESPIDYWADDYFFAHMIQHLLLMFAAPSLIVAGAPWQPLLAALPRRTGRSVTRGVLAAGWSRPLRGLGGLLLRPWVSVALFNAAMLLWHLPGPFDLAEENQAVHIWLMHGTMFGTGVLFWLQIIPSPPFRQRMPLLSQAGALLGTNVAMIGIAMTLSIFAQGSVYSVYDHIPGITLPAFADQQIGAAILWVCGDFWAMPSMIVIVRRMVATEGSMSAAVDKILSRGSARPGSWGWGRPGALAELRAQPPSSPEAGSLNGRRCTRRGRAASSGAGSSGAASSGAGSSGAGSSGAGSSRGPGAGH